MLPTDTDSREDWYLGGGDPSRIKGTIDWAGGEAEYPKPPFTMYVKSVEVVNYTPAKRYVYSDKSGSSDSIAINYGVSSGESSSSTSSSIILLR